MKVDLDEIERQSHIFDGSVSATHTKAIIDELRSLRNKLSVTEQSLKNLYEHDADYITINNLGPVDHNQVMSEAKKIIDAAKEQEDD